MFLLLAFIVIAMVAGGVANFLVGKPRKYEPWELFVIGIVGSFVGGMIFSLVLDSNHDLEIRPTGLMDPVTEVRPVSGTS